MRVLNAVLMLLLLSGGAMARDVPPVITAENIHNLKPASVVRFADLEPFPTGMDAQPLSGWFTLAPDGTKAAFVIDGGVRIVTLDASAPDSGWSRPDATVIDAHWDDTSTRLAVVYQHDGGYGVSVAEMEAITALDVPVSAGVPVRIWFDAETANYVWLEATPAPENADRSGFQVLRLDLADPQNEAPFALPTGPEHDFDSFVRIGRIPAPLAITATFAGTVRRWDLQTGEVTAEVALPASPTFGRVNETNGVEFAWRDEGSTALHLLNFETGKDVEVAPLHGEYIQALSVTPDASVILAVHRGDVPNITAWIVATGEEISLGEYDTSICSRVPDMVQLARNGSRLVIGCDGGFQVWETTREAK